MEISVVIPVFNAEKYVEYAVQSALQQKETAEVILVEDKSPDNALRICERLSEENPRVRLFTHSDGQNHGAGETRNLGIRKSRYEYVAFLDADDYYLENCFSRAAEILENDASADGVYGAVGVEFQNEEAKRRFFVTHKQEIATIDEGVSPEELFRFLVFGGAGYIHLNGLVVSKAGLLKVGLLPKLRLHQDMVLTIKLAAVLKLVAGDIDKPVSLRRIHLDNRITNQKTDFSETMFKAYRELHCWSKANKLTNDKQRLIQKKFWRLGYRFYKKRKSYPTALYYYALAHLFV